MRRIHSDFELGSIIFFGLLAGFDALAHWEKDKEKERRFAGIGVWCFVIAVVLEGIAYPYGQRNDTLSGKVIQDLATTAKGARSDADEAKSKSEAAKTKAGAANTAAGGAVTAAGIADSRAGKAQEKADSALSGAEAASKKLAEIEEELNRIKSPRDLTEARYFSDELRHFAGTRYTFAGVFNDDESVQFLKKIDSALATAGWIRVKMPIARGQTHIGLLQGTDDFNIPMVISTGILVEVDSPSSPESINDAPARLRTPIIKAAGQLQVLLEALITPSAKDNAGDSVRVMLGTSDVIRISVGKKP